MAKANCELCGDPMPAGEEMFKYHGYSGDCPKPPLPNPTMQTITDAALDQVADAINRARYVPGGLPERGLMDEGKSSQEYARRLARAAMKAMREIND
ncbi:MAG: hypothetical protein Q7R45_08350 [Sulfuricaulis sp.]|nr:hypothetical protein [Sulfuricaulis sp.]